MLPLAAACTALLISTGAPLSSLPPRYASWNIDSTRDRLFFDADLSSPQLAKLMAGASVANHSSLRFGGTGNDYLFYGGVGGSPACSATKPFAYECLNATLFDSLLALSGAAGTPIIFGLNIHPATGAPSPPAGPWDPTNARFLLAEAQRRGSPLSHLELGNEQAREEGGRGAGATSLVPRTLPAQTQLTLHHPTPPPARRTPP